MHTIPSIIFINVIDNSSKLAKITEIIQENFLQGRRILITVPSREAAQFMDTLLWKATEASFLPHIVTDRDTDEPIAITIKPQNFNRASVLLNLSQEISPIFLEFETVYELFDESHPSKSDLSRQKQSAYEISIKSLSGKDSQATP
jgi:DNA polymerase III subunit chi